MHTYFAVVGCILYVVLLSWLAITACGDDITNTYSNVPMKYRITAGIACILLAPVPILFIH